MRDQLDSGASSWTSDAAGTGGQSGITSASRSCRIGRTVYVLGMASDHTGALSICPMPGAGGRFMISLKTREQLIHAARQNSTALRYAAAGCVPAGVTLIVLGLLGLR